MSAPFNGRKHTPEALAKMRKAQAERRLREQGSYSEAGNEPAVYRKAPR